MTDKEVYKLVNEALFQTKSCSINTWYTIVINGRVMFEASINEKNYIHIRKPVKKADWYENRNDVFLYECFRFTGKKELVSNGMTEGTRPAAENRKEVSA